MYVASLRVNFPRGYTFPSIPPNRGMLGNRLFIVLIPTCLLYTKFSFMSSFSHIFVERIYEKSLDKSNKMQYNKNVGTNDGCH